MFRPRNELKAFLLLSTKNCQTPIKQTHTKPQETLEFKQSQPEETFPYRPPISSEGSWMIGLTN